MPVMRGRHRLNGVSMPVRPGAEHPAGFVERVEIIAQAALEAAKPGIAEVAAGGFLEDRQEAVTEELPMADRPQQAGQAFHSRACPAGDISHHVCIAVYRLDVVQVAKHRQSEDQPFRFDHGVRSNIITVLSRKGRSPMDW